MVDFQQMSALACPGCGSDHIIRKGVRQNVHRLVPRYLCKNCGRHFALAALPGAKYPPRAILTALGLYNLGFTQARVAQKISARFRLKIPQRTVSSWIERYAQLCTFGKLRSKAAKLFPPSEMVVSIPLKHRQVYVYKVHQAKLLLLEQTLLRKADFEGLREYLLSIIKADYPHRFFRHREDLLDRMNENHKRSSQTKLQFQPIVSKRRENLANDLAAMGLLLAKTRKSRHEQIQDFMLTNDSSTVACEVPVYLSKSNIGYFRRRFQVPVTEKDAPITGHIDILQVRQRHIHILDYKPEARLVQPVSQLTLYALALASHALLPLKLFKCAWFDEKDYFEFSPLHAVNTKRKGLPAVAE